MGRFGIWTIGKGRLAVIALLALLLVGCGQAAAASAPPNGSSMIHMTRQATTPSPAEAAVATTNVVIENFAFSPTTISVPVGSTVTWTNNDVEQHTVTARDRGFDSDAIASGQSFQFTFTRAGAYEYFCQIHPHMVGRVTVTAH